MLHETNLLDVLEKIGQPSKNAAPVSASLVNSLAEPEGLAPISRKNFFVHHDTHPVVFDVSLLKQYDADWFDWEAGTLWKEIKEDFRVPSISDHAKAKIQAVKTLHINEWYWDKWEIFCWITQALNNNIPDFQILQKPSVPQLMNSVDIATMVRDNEEFNQEVQAFVAAAMVEEGVFYAPDPIAFCQDEIIQLLKELKIEGVEEQIAAVKER